MASNSKQYFQQSDIDFLAKYIDTPSPSGQEVEAQKVWLQTIEPLVDNVLVDNYGNTVGIINPKAKFSVVLEAHADEISWMIKYITPEGFLHVTANGGMDPQIALGKQVQIQTPKGIVYGVFGWPAIHKREPGKDKFPKTKELWIDVGAANKADVEKLGIHIGCMATYTEGFAKLANGYWVGRAFDNKIGGFMLAQIAKKLKAEKIKLPYCLYLVNAVQEEVGLNGASMIVETLEPNMAIITDVTHDTTTPSISKNKEGEVRCGLGPAIGMAPSIHATVLNLIWNTAKECKIPHQLEAMSPVTGTDTDAFAYGNCGVPSALVSMPLRYMHTSVEMLAEKDVANTIELLFQTLLKIDPKTIKFTWR